jgi:hypothetical protein
MQLDELIVRWKRTTRVLAPGNQNYGQHLMDILEKRTDKELALFSDPVEAAAVFCLIDLCRTKERESAIPLMADVRYR